MNKQQECFAFILMPFHSSFDDIYRIGIKEIAELKKVRAERVDEQLFSEGIIERVYRQIDVADIVIADMSGQNPNVFYEVGYAHAKEKLTILLTNKVEDIPFDLRNRRHIVYNGSLQQLRSKLSDELDWAISQIDAKNKSRVTVNVKSVTGYLDVNKWSAVANLDFTIDLSNDSKLPSAEIESIYFYAGNDWKLSHDGKECPSTNSDLDFYKFRFFLSSPVRRLQPSGWCQLRFSARREMASALKGEELKDSYPINGRSIIRLTTNKGVFDYEIGIDLVVEATPF